MNLRDAAKQALEALEYGQHSLKQVGEHEWVSRGQLAMQALRAALEPEQAEPVMWMTHGNDLPPLFHKTKADALAWGAEPLPLYTAPPKQEQAEPVAWLYTNNAGVQALHIEPSWRLDADIKAAQEYPDTDKVTSLYAAPPQRKPLTDEQDRALCEAYCNDASDEYFKARPALDFPEMRRIFYAGHRKAWISYEAAHGIGEE